MYQLSFTNPSKKNIKNYQQQLITNKNIFSHFSLLFWEEHCVECISKYGINTCNIHTKRLDGGCATLVNGFEVIKQRSTVDGFSVNTEFKRLSKLESQWPFKPKMYYILSYKFLSFTFHSIDKFFYKISKHFSFAIKKNWRTYEIYRSYQYRLFKYIADNNHNNLKPDFLFFQIENLNEKIQSNMQIEILSDNKIRYRNKLVLKNKINTFLINFEELSFKFKNESLFRIWCDDSTEPNLLIHWAHLVKFKNKEKQLIKFKKNIIKNDHQINNINKIKCVVFDLDNTLWDGIVGDDNSSNIVLKDNVLKFIKDLDSKGIICSISSKNEYSVAYNKLKEFQIDQYFVFSEIHWGEKYISIKNISENMNINLDSIAFIDDSLFERRAVSNFLPEVKIFEKISLDLINDEIFDVPITNESRNRRKFYISDNQRKKDERLNSNDSLAFIKSCKLEIRILETKNNINRCCELLQRTNQFNISKHKYSLSDLSLHLKNNLSFCWDLKDKYGSYGIVGFISYNINHTVLEISEFTMSCRAAARYAEESLFTWLHDKHNNLIDKIIVNFQKSERNNPIYEKLIQIGFDNLSSENREKLVLNLVRHNKFSGVIKIIDKR